MPDRPLPKRRSVPRVTVVDDSTEFVDLLREALEPELECVVAGLTSGDITAEEMAATQPDLLIVDLRLDNARHDASGWELLLLARAHPALRSVPVLLCSADFRQLREREEALASMADVCVLAKPFSLDELYRLTRELLAAPGAPRPAA